MASQQQCRLIAPLLWDHASGVLAGDDLNRVNTHLHDCEKCQKEAAHTFTVVRLIDEDREQSIPVCRPTWSDVMQRLSLSSKPTGLWLFTQPNTVIMMAALLLFSLITVVGIRYFRHPQVGTTQITTDASEKVAQRTPIPQSVMGVVTEQIGSTPRPHMGSGGGGFGGTMWVGPMTDSAKTIVYGTVKTIEPRGDETILVTQENQGYLAHGVPTSSAADTSVGRQWQVHVKLANIQIDRVIKGSVQPPGGSIAMTLYQSDQFPRPWDRLEAGQHGLFFLDSANAPVDVYHAMFPIADGIDPPGSGLAPLEEVKYYVTASVRPGVSDELLETCVDTIEKLQIREAGDNLAAMLASAKPKTASWVLKGLLRLQDIRAFPAASDFILNPPSGATDNDIGYVVGAISTLTNPSVDDSVIGLLHSQNARVHRPAIEALRHMRTVKGVTALAEVIDGPNSTLDEKYMAMMGTIEWRYGDWDRGQYNSLTPEEATNLPDMPGGDLFQKDPEKYLSKWRLWWEKEKPR
ncbi:MAG: hypothetical protein ACYC0V_18530 [Armatimonadota bacterium]